MLSTPQQSRFAGKPAIGLYALIGAGFLPLLLLLGANNETLSRVIAVIFTLLNSAWIPLIYLLGSLGLGKVARRWTRELPTRWVIELCIGFTLTLTLTHALGMLGILNTLSAWIVTGLGLLIVIIDLRDSFDQPDSSIDSPIDAAINRITLTIPGVCFILGCITVIAMSCNPPGISWDSEFGSYDALSYHLELPREWLEAGRIWPSEHNVYSFLPGYIESAYLHFAYLSNAPKATTGLGVSGFMANDSRALMSTHLFSAFLLIISALAVGSLTKRAINIFRPDADAKTPAMCAQALMMCTPWLTLVGSLAYNETGVILLAIGAFAIAIEQRVSPTTRAAITALLVGGACCIKLTAIFLLAPSVAVVLLAFIPMRNWIKPLLLGLMVGFITIAPWLIRNELATGNPVFPQLSSLFGAGHWTDAQHSIYTNAHHFQGSPLDRLQLLALPDPSGTDHISTFRGFTNLQWAIIPWLGFLGLLVLIFKKSTRPIGLLAALAIILPILGWLSLTHLQSRFLIPITPLLVATASLALTSINHLHLRTLIITVISCVSLLWLLAVVSIQSNANPFPTLVFGSSIYTGEITPSNPPWTNSLNSILNEFQGENETVYLLGDAAGLYVRSPLLINTVYDHWPIQEAIEAHPTDPSKWSSILIEQGIDVVVIGSHEILRFEHSGWLPKSISTDNLREWIKTLPEPIYIWTLPQSSEPIRAAYRLRKSDEGIHDQRP